MPRDQSKPRGPIPSALVCGSPVAKPPTFKHEHCGLPATHAVHFDADDNPSAMHALLRCRRHIQEGVIVALAHNCARVLIEKLPA